MRSWASAPGLGESARPSRSWKGDGSSGAAAHRPAGTGELKAGLEHDGPTGRPAVIMWYGRVGGVAGLVLCGGCQRQRHAGTLRLGKSPAPRRRTAAGSHSRGRGAGWGVGVDWGGLVKTTNNDAGGGCCCWAVRGA